MNYLRLKSCNTNIPNITMTARLLSLSIRCICKCIIDIFGCDTDVTTCAVAVQGGFGKLCCCIRWVSMVWFAGKTILPHLAC